MKLHGAMILVMCVLLKYEVVDIATVVKANGCLGKACGKVGIIDSVPVLRNATGVSKGDRFVLLGSAVRVPQHLRPPQLRQPWRMMNSIAVVHHVGARMFVYLKCGSADAMLSPAVWL